MRQKGISGLMLLAIVGVLGFLAITFLADFKNSHLRTVYNNKSSALATQLFPGKSSTPSAVPNPTLSPNSSACTITEAHKLSDGGDGDWSKTNNKIVFQKWDSNNYYQLHTINPDGSGETCLTCNEVTGGSTVDRHKLGPVWSKDGNFIVASVEMKKHPLAGLNIFNHTLLSELNVNGLWNNLYAISPDGQKWYKLTDYSANKPDGAMGAHFSPDGKKIAWSRIVEKASAAVPWGNYRLMIADFVVVNGVPNLQNVQDITPPNSQFNEAHEISQDNSTLLYASNMAAGSNRQIMDIYKMNLADRTVTKLTTSQYWSEHAYFTSGGQRIVYMSWQKGLPLATELTVMNLDGSNKTQLTKVNYPKSVEYVPGLNYIMHPSFNADGTKMIATLQSVNKYPQRQQYIYSFAGSCN